MDCIIEQVFPFCFYAIHLPPAEEGEFLLYYVKYYSINAKTPPASLRDPPGDVF